ncbi:hypothetical protein [Shewanella putrefaciens]|uniref:hypothetical protein n=1 Tax=Shewanella putrefaciens TaxID=24 RepID=UPI0035638B1A
MTSNYSAAYLVLLYRKEVNASETLNSIKLLSLKNNNYLLVIWNNGPKPLIAHDIKEFEQLGFDVVIKETVENESLSKVYNHFIDNFYSNKYIILDDDSCLNQEYFNEVFDLKKNEIGVPLIFSNGKLTGPKLNRKLCQKGHLITEKDKFIGIGSGLVIGQDIVEKLKRDHRQVFDERFYFYGVDTTFFFRVKQSLLSERMKVISGFEHSLSKLKKESEPVTDFRLKEMSYDIGLRLRYYKPVFSGFILLIKESISSLVKLLCKKKPKVEVKHLLNAYLSGKHYRE